MVPVEIIWESGFEASTARTRKLSGWTSRPQYGTTELFVC
jgi:hypothetical protein